jgi:hypothetical protein
VCQLVLFSPAGFFCGINATYRGKKVIGKKVIGDWLEVKKGVVVGGKKELVVG